MNAQPVHEESNLVKRVFLTDVFQKFEELLNIDALLICESEFHSFRLGDPSNDSDGLIREAFKVDFYWLLQR